MRKRISLLLVLGLVLLLVACGGKSSTSSSAPASSAAPEAGKFTPGTYESTAKGYGGEFKVTVTLSSNRIEKIEVGPNNETPAVGGVAIEKLPADIIAKQTLAVDSVSGATITSTALIDAITAALVSAGVDVSELQTPTPASSAA